MACELTFEATGEARGVDELREFLRSRPWYDVGEDRAEYVDEDTGVAFALQWAGSSGELDSIAFSMEFLRPRFFGLEAATELEALVGEFDLAPRDSADGGELGTFATEDFLEGWDRGNRAVVADADGEDLPSHSAPAERLRDAWRWNRARQEYQTVLGEAIFVPSTRLLADGDEVFRACAWPETIPIALPDAADLVLVSGVEHEGLTSGGSELRVADADRISDLVTSHTERLERREDPTDHVLIGWAQPPPEVLEELAQIGDPADERQLTPVSPDEVLEEALLERSD